MPPRPSKTEAVINLGRSVARAEAQATRAAAGTIVRAGRYVRRHPWESVLLAAGAAFIVTAVAGRRNDSPAVPSAGAANDGR